MSGFNMDDYVPVNERIEAFKKQHPEGSLQSEILHMSGERVTVKAYAYRTPDDPRPGTGLSSETIPGATTFTRGSEVENAETSAWGRAIAALGFEVKRGIASREEMRRQQPQGGERVTRTHGRRAESRQPATTRPAAVRSHEEQDLLDQLLALPGMTRARLDLLADAAHVKGERATADELREMLRIAQTPVPTPAPSVAGRDAPASEGEAARSGAASPDSDAEPGLPGADSATSAAASPPPGGGSPAAPTDEQILAAAGEGSEIVPPQPGTAEYKALPNGTERARAKAYWDALAKEQPQQESLAEALGGVSSD